MLNDDIGLKRRLRRVVIAPAVAILALSAGQEAEAQDPGDCEEGATRCSVGDKVIYKPAYFSQFNPVNALDMVRRVPGFVIDPGDNVRGFGGAAGNVLIDGQRPSTKSADIFDILGRIGVSGVERIELIRGGTGGLDVGGQSVVVNVVRNENAAGSSVWEFRLLKRRPDGGVRPSGEVSFTGKWGEFQYTVGAGAYGFSTRFGGDETITRFFGDDERRRRDGAYREQGGSANLKLERAFASGDVVRFNAEAEIFRNNDKFTETRFLATGGPDEANFAFPFKFHEFEVGADYEHAFSSNLGVKLIALYGREISESESRFEFLPALGDDERSEFLSNQTEGETIGRVEFDWSGWRGHTVQFGGEVARTFIDSEAALFAEDASGVLIPVPINGANTRVAELRGEPFVNDTWSLGERLTLDTGFAVEFSRIAQSGDNANSRFFVYPKPSATLTFAQSPTTQFRLSAKREVNQLSFDQFVSSVNFDDEDVDFGNPDLQPQRTWAFAAVIEKRFGDIGVVELTGFFDYVQDVEDVLPIGGIVEVPGNIGDGKIYGAALKMTAPLDWLGLKNARLDAETTIRDSQVTDPVTGAERNFSFTPNRIYEVEFRQDFPARKISWGGGVEHRSEEFSFGIDEVVRATGEAEIEAFIETTAIKGVRARFQVFDVLNTANTRDRTVFQGPRSFGAPDFREVRENRNGGAFRLEFSGAF